MSNNCLRFIIVMSLPTLVKHLMSDTAGTINMSCDCLLKFGSYLTAADRLIGIPNGSDKVMPNGRELGLC